MLPDEERLEPEELLDRVLATRESREQKVPPEGLVARELTLVGSRVSTRPRAPPSDFEVARAVIHAHTPCFERFEAAINAAIQVLLWAPEPGAPGCRFVLGLALCFFFFCITIIYRSNR
jgi:hypothetical protein